MATETRYYTSYATDFVTSKTQDYRLPADYQWQHPGRAFQLTSSLVYRLAGFAGSLYNRVYLHERIVGREKLRATRGRGAFLYLNHTQPVGDAFTPMRIAGRGRASTVAAPANLGIPVIGPLIALGRGLVLPSGLHQLGRFTTAMNQRLEAGDLIAIYPEAHVWPYATMIRPFVSGSLHYPVATNRPVYAATSTYTRRKYGKRPRKTVYIDGPFYPDLSLRRSERQEDLAQKISAAMQTRAQQSNVEYIRYRPVAERSTVK
ncbi:lysophospholipid acyltransferase family protein [Lacticaseibacillus zhaodongensis]|uniref:lysophospholipid acyltransferase family protein n=1 Tax=Lacticaseibacillus zhaodongensis TaxID=2668065 RepID=UPI0012D2C9D2|nr:1-acyl-sn-glycerol-3-phosphate acyltransferase [Lacticaseibacillus zhaodongensis]